MKKYVKASVTAQPYTVHYGIDQGGPESGPIFKSFFVIVDATSEEEAIDTAIEQYELHDLEGIDAHPATDYEIAEWEKNIDELNDPDRYPF